MKEKVSITGVVSLITMFCVLCLAVFSILSLTSMNRQAEITKLITTTLNYYAADTEATEILSEIIRNKDNLNNIQEKYNLNLFENEINYNVLLDSDKQISIKLLHNQDDFQILAWKLEYIGEWKPNTTLKVFDTNR